MTAADEPAPWLADPTVEWRIVLTADLPTESSTDQVTRRLHDLNRRLGAAPGPGLVASGPGETLLTAVTRSYPDVPVAAGLEGTHLVLAGEHRFVDGLGMLAVLSELTDVPAASAARGLGPRDEPTFVTEVARRLVEVAVRPPARVAPTADDEEAATGSTFADLLLDRRVGVTELIDAAVRGVVAFNRERGQRHRRVAVAVGASAVGGGHVAVADHSALLRLRSAERLDQDAIRTFLASAPTVPSPGQSVGGSSPWMTRAGAVAVRVLGPRLGSTLTVSHLGDVTSPAGSLAFYPVAGGSSGVALGAVTHDGRTRITLRGRRSKHSAEGLEALLALVAAPLS
ncbi:MAG: hypothetical protein JWN84_2791 [Nocardioides sp.]|nr:hypothetical protein [Nocardioides sp.]